MSRIIFLFMVITLTLNDPCRDIYAQKETNNKTDTLIIGGIYRISLIDGRDYTGELKGVRDSTIIIKADSKMLNIVKSQIRSIEIGGLVHGEKNIITNKYGYYKKKFKFLCSFQAGISDPTGNFGDVHKSGFGIQFTVYHLFSRVIGMSTELQFNNFPGKEIYYRSYNYYNNSYNLVKTQSSDFRLYVFKLNLVAGNLNPDSKIVFYGLTGFAYQYYDPWGEMTYSFGAGCGAFYKISKGIGINGEIQYNKLPVEENLNHYGYGYDYSGNDDFSGCFSFRLGIMITIY